jgi:uncharacterized YccA/Bax inhibitor family protein
MRFLNARIHGYLDVATVVLLVVGPLVMGLGGTPAAICYALAVAHLLLTLLTDYPMGAKKVIPLFVHGLIELVVGVLLLVLPSLIGFGPGSPARRFYIFAGAAILVVWVLTDYGRREEART